MRTIKARTPSRTSTMIPARKDATSWLWVWEGMDERQSGDDAADPGRSGCDAITRS